jgi:2-methylcitrate dehydratase PrpD
VSTRTDRDAPSPSAEDVQQSLTEQLAEFVTGTSAADLPQRAIGDGKYFLLDWLSSAIAGTTTRQGRMILAHAAEQGAGPSTVMALAEKKGTQAASFANGSLSHMTETDDVHRSSVVHPATVVIPAALAVAERMGSRGVDFLTAIVLGYEVFIRVGEAVGNSHYYYWHNTSTCGTFGAAAASGWLLGISKEQMWWALGNAGSMSSGLWQFNEDGAMAKHMHAGHASSSGVLVAELAARGFTGTRRILEGKRGLFAATSRDARPELVTVGLKRGMEHYKISECVIKPYPSCRHTHAPVDLALRLRQEIGIRPEQVDRIEVDTYQATVDLTDNPIPTHEYAAKFSTQYCISAALALGRLTLGDFGPDSREDATTRGLMARTQVRIDPEIQARYPKEWCCRVAITSKAGERWEAFTDTPKGDPENPLSLEELREKFRSMVAGTRYEPVAERLIESVDGLDQIEDVRALLP